MATARAANPYQSFWMGGFEGADHANFRAEGLDLVQATGHLDHLEGDYRRVAELGIGTVRESVGWRLCEKPGAARTGPARFDFTRALRFADAARRHGIQIMWTLMHYGRPADVDVFSDDFADRFADFAGAAARALRQPGTRPPIYTPINEISFLAWAIAETNFIHPYCREAQHRQQGEAHRCDIGWEAKWRLVRASLLAIQAILAEDACARFLHVEPLTHVVPPPGAPHLAPRAAEIAGYQWQAWDMLSGALLPELGGNARALDLLGVNYYHNCQWEMETGQRLEWHLDDPRRVSFSSLLRKAWKRYDKPLIVAETSHVGSGRARWIQDIAFELARARDGGVPVLGVCLYPVIDRPDWNDASHWHNSGLWDVAAASEPGPAMVRSLSRAYAKALLRAQRQVLQTPLSGPPMRHLIVFSHLRWAFVLQRPQHLLSRLARDFQVVFVEEPVRHPGAAFLERTTPCKGVEVLRPHTAVEGSGFHDDQLSGLQPMLANYLADNAIDDYLVWFYTPMALPLLSELQPKLVVYDCMDELAAFKNAPRQMRQREAALLKRADLVLTGGPRLYAAKRELNENVVCLPSAVDAAHYAPARSRQDAAAVASASALQGHIGAPRLGYFGVIDERIDLDLLARLADAEPAWQIVLVGPVVKIAEAELPRRGNLHWLGQQPYALLPQLIAGWSVCLMPFALNEATNFISPTKTLEYMAAGRPVISTAIQDVEALFGDVVAIADSAETFVAACRAAVVETPTDAAARELRTKASVGRCSWDDAAAVVRGAIAGAMQRQTDGPAPPGASEPEPAAAVLTVNAR